jgi:nitroreductase
MAAPSAGNEQPWQFIVVRDRAQLARIPKASPYAAMAKQAAVAIAICGDSSLEKYPGFWSQDCCLAGMNVLLAAQALGLGAVWTAAWPMQDRVEKLSALFGLPPHVIPLCVIPIGHPQGPGQPEDRYRPERVHADRW